MKKFLSLSLVTMTLLVGAAISRAEGGKSPAVGDAAPLVEGKNQDGQNWKLADDIGKKVVLLYFYPKDNTPGCTKEACGLRDRMGTLPESFGIKHKENVPAIDYYNASLRPSAFVGWNNDAAAGFANYISYDHIYFWQHFQYTWAAQGLGVKSALYQASSYPDDTYFSYGNIVVFGDWDLTVNGFNR